MCCPRGRDAAVPLMERGVSLSPLAASSAHIASELNAGNDGTVNAIYVYRYSGLAMILVNSVISVPSLSFLPFLFLV